MAKPIKLLDNANQIVTLLSEIGAANHALIATEIGVPRSSVYRLVEGLAAINLVRIDPTGVIRLSERWLHLAQAAQRSFPEWQHVLGRLESIAERTGQTSFLSIPTPTGAACIAWAPASSLVVLSLRPGRQFPFNLGAAGRLLFALAPAADQAEYLANCEFTGQTSQSITTPEALLADAETIRETGWVLSDEDVNTGLAAVGVAAYPRGGASMGCVSISGLRDDIVGRAGELAAILADEVSLAGES